MSIQRRSDRNKFSRLRRTLLVLSEEVTSLLKPFLSDKAVIKGSLYELKRKCGKPGCKCTRGELHSSMVVSDSEKGKKSLRIIPRGLLVDVRAKVRRYRQLRRCRARLVEVHKEMLRVMDEMERLRRQGVPSAGTKRRLG
ncbi:MAG: DUF6788 family protein [Dehalococcoidia bacterium]